MLEVIRTNGAKIFILSLSNSDVINQHLHLAGLSDLIAPAHVFGSNTAYFFEECKLIKSTFIEQFGRANNWDGEEVLFVDDRKDHIDLALAGRICLTLHVPTPQGMMHQDFETVKAMVQRPAKSPHRSSPTHVASHGYVTPRTHYHTPGQPGTPINDENLSPHRQAKGSKRKKIIQMFSNFLPGDAQEPVAHAYPHSQVIYPMPYTPL